MRRPRLFFPAPLAGRAEARLDESQAKYVRRVLRLDDGDEIVLFDGRGGEHHGSLRLGGKRATKVVLAGHVAREAESPLEVTLFQGISRSERMDYTIQKATELGVTAIVPVAAARSVVRLSGERAATRRRHWQRIAASACEQCGRNRVPAVGEITSLDEALAMERPPHGLPILLDAQGSRTLADLARPGGGVLLLAGPEGGLTGDEHERARAARFVSVNLGPRILRTETAAVAALAALQTLWGDLARA